MMRDRGESPGSSLRRARTLLERGEVPQGLVADQVSRSWRRSVAAGLLPFGRAQDPVLSSRSALQDAMARRDELVSRARPVLEYLHAQTRGSGSLVILADDRGVILDSLGEGDFLNRADKVALKPGASWHECHRGTNAIGTALAEQAPVCVHGAEHFLEHNGFLTCAAAPLLGPDGRLLGAVDISGHWRGRQAHSSGLVLAAAHMIENRLFESRFADQMVLRLHPSPDGIGSIAEGLVALNEHGLILGANRAGMALMNLEQPDLGRLSIDRLLDGGMGGLFARSQAGRVRTVTRRDGMALSIRVDDARPLRMPAVVSVAKPRMTSGDALTALDLGDGRWREIVARARKLAGKAVSLLILGESGTGKEVLARAIHASGPRSGKPFVAVNCAALPEHLIEAELFGYAGGAFTGAKREGMPGRIREAQGGTLFLDEIGDMPPALQSRLLRVLQDHEVIPLGGGKAAKVDFALMAATHQPLKDLVAAGRFRADLYYRLNGMSFTLPPLRERSDLPALIAAMLARLDHGGRDLAPSLHQALIRHDWPGNARQLAQGLAAACAMLDPEDERIDWQHLPEDLSQDLSQDLACLSARKPAPDSLRAQQDLAIQATLAQCGGNMARAARKLGISRSTLYRRLCPQ